MDVCTFQLVNGANDPLPYIYPTHHSLVVTAHVVDTSPGRTAQSRRVTRIHFMERCEAAGPRQ